MKQNLKRKLRPLLFTLGGALAGFLYYRFSGCQNGTCLISSSPVNSMLYMGFVGWLLSKTFGKGCGGRCRL